MYVSGENKDRLPGRTKNLIRIWQLMTLWTAFILNWHCCLLFLFHCCVLTQNSFNQNWWWHCWLHLLESPSTLTWHAGFPFRSCIALSRSRHDFVSIASFGSMEIFQSCLSRCYVHPLSLDVWSYCVFVPFLSIVFFFCMMDHSKQWFFSRNVTLILRSLWCVCACTEQRCVFFVFSPRTQTHEMVFATRWCYNPLASRFWLFAAIWAFFCMHCYCVDCLSNFVSTHIYAMHFYVFWCNRAGRIVQT